MTRTASRRGSTRLSFAAVIGIATLMVPVLPVLGAAAAEDEEDAELLEEVKVTGTRIQSPNVTSANPINTVTGEEMRQLGIVNVADALTLLVPQNISAYTPAMTGDDQSGIDRGSFFIGNTIANLRGLDPEFGTRTLTLIDGRRVPSTSNQADVVDLNIIPSNLLQRMDVVTGGASATYGSGAMAGVVNLVLNNRMSGMNVDVDYGVNETGDGGSPHVSISGGTSMFGGRGHGLLGVEWQNSSAIRDCSKARDWCALSRQQFANYSGTAQAVTNRLVPLPGFGDQDGDGVGDYPARFQMTNVRYSQFAPTGTIYSSSANNTSGYRFTEDGTGIEEYAYGVRGGTGRSTMNGDGPLQTSGTVMRPSTERKSLFANFEFNFTERTTGYVQASYARTDSLNRNRYTQGNACIRFNTMGEAAVPGGSAHAGDVIYYGNNGESWTDFPSGLPAENIVRTPITANPNFRVFAGNLPAPTTAGITARTAPYIVTPGQLGSSVDDSVPPTYTGFSSNVTNPVYRRVRSASGSNYWSLVSVTLTADFDDPGTPANLPQLGRNAYYFLNNLSPEALNQVQRAFDNSTTTGGGPGLDTLYGVTPCDNFTAMRKVWNPQIQQWTDQVQEPWRAVAGIKGRFGGDWRWEAYFQHGETTSTSRQNNVQTNLSFAFAMDAVIDDRVDSDTYGQPICRILRDGIPVLDAYGRPTSDPEGLAALAAGCKPLNIFGSSYSDPAAAQLQREALNYAFKENISDGSNSLDVLSFTANGTLWQGWAGPLSGAFGIEVREDSVDNKGSRGPYYARADIGRQWGDAFGGTTRVTEGYTELDMPLLAGMEGVNLLSVNVGARYASYHNKGGAGTTGQSATQDTMNWKFQAIYEPFDWMRLRVTRSRDLRAAGYRELFINQPGIPDSTTGTNPWREKTEDSEENQRERWGLVQVGNANLKPEKSNTLTMGLVLSPGGWAQGMRMSADYYSISVKDGIYTPFAFANPVISCWENSGNVDFEDDPDNAMNGLYNDNLAECREILFGTNPDGSRNLQDIVAYNSSRPVNGLPYWRRGVDLSWSYSFPMSRAFESVPGTMSLTLRGTRALEASGIQQTCTLNSQFQCEDTFTYVDQVGQIRNSVFIPGVTPSPKWSGNVITSYRVGNLTTTLSARYIGGAKLDNTWSDNPDDPNFRDADGNYLYGSVDNNWVKPYVNFGLNGSYDLRVSTLKGFQVFGSVSNLFDKSPPYTGGGISGASAQYHDTMGRAYRMGVRMRF